MPPALKISYIDNNTHKQAKHDYCLLQLFFFFFPRELMKASILSNVTTFDQNNNNLWAERKYVLQYNPQWTVVHIIKIPDIKCQGDKNLNFLGTPY